MLYEHIKEGAVVLSIPDDESLFCKKNNLIWKAFAILKAFRDPDERLTCQELSQRARLPKASGHRLILTLEEIGAVVRGPQGRYQLGMPFVSLSQNVAKHSLLRRVAEPVLRDLANDLEMTVHMGALNGGMVTYLSKIAVPGSFQTHTKPDAQLEAYCTGLGKVLLAALPEEQLESVIMDGALVALTPFTITEPNRLRAELVKVRNQGFAEDDRETRTDMRCLAVPVRDGANFVVAAISCTAPFEQISDDNRTALCGVLHAASRAVTARLYPSL